jgi:hypothetical protein
MKKIISASLLLLALGGAHAQVYVGGNLGQSTLNVGCSSGAANCDKYDTGFKISAGYADDEIPHAAVELGYLGFGEGKTRRGTVNYDVKSRAIYVAGGLHADFTQKFGGSLRLGLASVKTTCGYTGGGGSKSEVVASGYLGVGLDYAITPHIKAVAAVDMTSGECAGQQGQLRLFSLGGQYTF